MSKCCVQLLSICKGKQIENKCNFFHSTISLSLEKICPSNTPNGEQTIHFFKFKEIYSCLHLSSINHNFWTCFFRKLNIVQSSKYTSKNLWMKFLKATTTTLSLTQKAWLCTNMTPILWKMLSYADPPSQF